MNNMASCSSSQEVYIIEDDEEDTEVTGGKSVSEIVQLLRTSTKFVKSNKGGDDHMFLATIPKNNKFYPWLSKFVSDCKECIIKLTIPLNDLVTTLLPHLENEVKNIVKKPKRATKLRLELRQFITLFHFLYSDLKRSVEVQAYLDNMVIVLALYIDVELNAARYEIETAKKISCRICSMLHINLDNSIDHMLNALLKSKFLSKKYSNPRVSQKVREIGCPILEKLQVEIPPVMKESSYVRYLLAFKIWRKLAGKEQSAKITNLAVETLKPPADFCEKLKSGIFSNVLPYVTKPDKHRLTWFFMVSPFNVAEKSQAFLKEKDKNQHIINLEKPYEDSEDLQLYCGVFSMENSNGSLLNSIWCDVNKSTCNEDNVIDEMLLADKSVDVKDYLLSGHANKGKEKLKRFQREAPTVNVDRPPSKKMKFDQLTTEETLQILDVDTSDPKVKEFLHRGLSMDDLQVSLNGDDNENPCLLDIEIIRKRPCATVESEQSKEIEPSSQSTSGFKKTGDDNVEAGKITSSDTSLLVNDVACEEVKLSGASRGSDGDQHQPADQLQLSVFEEIITEEISQGEASTLVFLDLNGQVNIPDNILNTINVSQETEQVVPLTVKNTASTNSPDTQNCERQKVSSEGQPFPPLVQAENKTDLVSLGRRDDCFSYNDTMFTRFLFEGNADEGTDDESGYINRRKYAGGGKVIAFREQQEDSKSDVGEECESPPSSRSDSQRSVDLPSPGMTTVALAQHSFVEDDHTEVQYKNFCGVSVSLTDIASHCEMTDKTLLAVRKEGTCESCISVHDRTRNAYGRYYDFQKELWQVYSTAPHMAFSKVCPSPHEALNMNDKPFCNCNECHRTYLSVRFNWKTLTELRNNVIINYQMEQKLSQTVNSVIKYETKLEDPVEEVIESKIVVMVEADQRTFPTHCEISNSASAPESDKQLVTLIVPEQIKNTNDTKTEYSSLPPKKRKAFNLQLSESVEQEESANNEPKIAKTDFQNQDEMPLDHRLKECETDDSPKTSDLIKGCSVVVNKMPHNNVVVNRLPPNNRLTGVVIKSVDGKYTAEPKTSSTTEFSDSNSDEGKVKEKRDKSACRHGKDKKERCIRSAQRHLQKAMKRLKKKREREQRVALDGTI